VSHSGSSSAEKAGSSRLGGTSGLIRRQRSRRGAIGEINVTPLVDVVLVLLLVFMVTAPMMSRGIDLTLPTADQPDTRPEDRLSVSIDENGRVYLGERVIALPLLEEQVRAAMDERPESARVAYLRADERLRYGKVIEVVDLLKRSGVERIGFAYDLPERAQ
jgi:biopolymer transport protein TolR